MSSPTHTSRDEFDLDADSVDLRYDINHRVGGNPTLQRKADEQSESAIDAILRKEQQETKHK